MRFHAFLFLSSLFLTATLQAQEDDPTTINAVQDVVKLYLQGQSTYDPAIMRRAFSPSAYLVYQKEGALFFEPSTTFVQRLPGHPMPDEAQRQRRIVEVHSTPTTGYAVLEFSYPSAKLVEYLLIDRDKDGWVIVAETFHRYPAKAEKP